MFDALLLPLADRPLPPGWIFRSATPADADLLADRLRAVDRAEVIAATGEAPLPVLRDSIGRAERAWCLTIADRPALLAGVVRDPHRAGTGVPWMLADDRIDRRPWTLARHSRAVLTDGLAPGFRRLENAVDARNRRTVRWLAWLGFTIRPARPLGPYGQLFHPFDLTLSEVPPCAVRPSSPS